MTREEKEYIFHNMRNAVVQPSEPMNLEEMRAYINGYEDARNALFDIVDRKKHYQTTGSQVWRWINKMV